ncbi:hypothetical protein [Flavobacterium oreochromis]|uniref:Uncharacterized protein n=2 Tax=Flavobacterium TaxID=237 RepID=A0A246G798_9FLAO|nr:hypothetical protein [Flavobacterium oreochromis]OWP74129.1 hypothetical protein BWG23_14900 [Flavobacterium oreochromis]OWP74271.1 hypothetical protein BWK62_14695 [Flavobacterium oreochromis]POR19706.1 hypothetical protein BWK58_14245 [Flavobacterium columnare]
MDSIKVSKYWLDWFHNESIELVTTIDNSELFIESIQGNFKGNQVNYQTVFKLLDAFIKSFDFLMVEEIRLIWCDELKDLQFYYAGQDYKIWKESILQEGFKIDWQSFAEYEDCTDIYYNYNLIVEGENSNLYKYNQNDRTAIYLWYNLTTDTTYYKIEIELRKSLFKLDDNFEISISDSNIEHNKIVLELSKNMFLIELKS